ncbi:MAG: 4-hydroxy-tetrahydrodipicolinate reductase [Polyangiaceae bacterium]
MIRLAVLGASGRMGQAVLRLANELDFEVVGQVSAGEDLSVIARSKAEVVIDFSSPDATRALIKIAADAGAAIVSGTTGLDELTLRELEVASAKVPIFWAPNMSVGVHVLGVLVARAIEMLGPEFDIEITEAHHRRKVDAPSGTALRLAEVAQAARSGATKLEHGRSGRPGARAPSEIGMHAIRGGDVIGDHHVHLLGEGERLELVHRASSRDLFARGALRAARFVVGKAPGRYAMSDLFN